MGAGVAANPHCPVPSAEPQEAGVLSGVPGCPRSRSSARPDGFPPSFGHRCRPGFRFPRVPFSGASLRPLPVPVGTFIDTASLPSASGPFRSPSVAGIAADHIRFPAGFLAGHRCPARFPSGRRPGIAARPGPRRRQSKPGPRLPPVCGSFLPEGVPVPPGSAGKWERLRLSPLPHASSLIALPLLRSLIPPLRASWLRAAAAAARSFLRSGALAPRFRPLPATR